VGLGAGAVAAYARPEDEYLYIEIDPAIARIAQDTRYFTFLSNGKGEHHVVIGDGRLLLQDQPDRAFSLIFLDAYSSDAVPTHLLTREALELYMNKLADDGLLVFHISNRVMNLEPVVANLANDANLHALAKMESLDQFSEQELAFGIAPAHVVVLARNVDDLFELGQLPGWRKAQTIPDDRVWTDDYADVLSLLRRGPALTATP